MRTTDKHVFFWKGNFSNWCRKFPFERYGQKFDNSEQAFMWVKAMTFNDIETAAKILLETDPAKVKALGREVKNYDDALWTEFRFEAMYKACIGKFLAYPELTEELLATGEKVLVEASPKDQIWGIGMAENDEGVDDEKNWKGLNLLGQVLMKVRENIQYENKRKTLP